VTIAVGPAGVVDHSGEHGAVAVRATVGDSDVLDGSVGLGTAPWAPGIDPPPVTSAEDPPALRPTYTVDDAPIGRPLRPLGVYVSADAARRISLDDLGQSHSHVPGDRLHPWFLAARMAPLTRHNFTYGPTIHVRTQIQHLGPANVDQDVVIGARIVEVYERNDHWYQVLDGLVVGDAGAPGAPQLARVRHHSIFRPRGTTMPSPMTSEPPG
jgi:hypothetical protein